MDWSLRTLSEYGIGPLRNFDLIFCFFDITTPELVLNCKTVLSMFSVKNVDLTNQHLTMSPFTEYLYLKPLYSSLGGSTIRAEPFTKKLGLDFLRLKPLYKWNIFIQDMFVLSDICNQDSFNNSYWGFLLFTTCSYTS